MSVDREVIYVSDEKNNEKKGDKSKSNAEKGDLNSFFKSKFGEYKAEFKKIIWLSRKELTKRTVTVIITSLLFGLVIFGMDSIFTLGTQYFFVLIGK